MNYRKGRRTLSGHSRKCNRVSSSEVGFPAHIHATNFSLCCSLQVIECGSRTFSEFWNGIVTFVFCKSESSFARRLCDASLPSAAREPGLYPSDSRSNLIRTLLQVFVSLRSERLIEGRKVAFYLEDGAGVMDGLNEASLVVLPQQEAFQRLY